jgi:Rps23 Pro-64 3,4-dihydroxylase Tpa1-like proline 4-hydroxylase
MTETSAQAPDTKRRRTFTVLSQDFNETSLRDECVKQLRAKFQSSGPYNHVVIPDLCNRNLLRQAREELINNVEAKLKETDLFKVFPII